MRPRKKKYARLEIRLPDDHKTFLEQCAKQSDITLSELIRSLIEEFQAQQLSN